MVAGLATMNALTPSEYQRLNALGDRLRSGGNRIFEAAGEQARVGGAGSLVRINQTTDAFTDYRSWLKNQGPASRMAALHGHLLDEGVIIARGGTACLSTPMSDIEIDAFLAALERAVAKLGPPTR
jgi:glutamate-1-semialdehyde 2,1-aminomutase